MHRYKIQYAAVVAALGLGLAACQPVTLPEQPGVSPTVTPTTTSTPSTTPTTTATISPTITTTVTPIPTFPVCLDTGRPSVYLNEQISTSDMLDLNQVFSELVDNKGEFSLIYANDVRVDLSAERVYAFSTAAVTGEFQVALTAENWQLDPNCPAVFSKHYVTVSVDPGSCLVPMPGIFDEFTRTAALNESISLSDVFGVPLDSKSSYRLVETDGDGDLVAQLGDDFVRLVSGDKGQVMVDRVSMFRDISADYCPVHEQTTHRLLLSLSEAVTEPELAMPIIAYQPSWAFDLSRIHWEKLSKIIYSFALPDFDGSMTISQPHQLAALRAAADNTQTEVWLAIGGWDIGHGGGNDAAWSAIMVEPALLSRFKSEILTAVQTYDLDGIDVDWEWPSNSTQQAQFLQLMQELYDMLDPLGVKLSTAVVSRGANGNFIDSRVFDLVEYINIMAYDDNWPWDNSHSDMNIANAALDYWVNQRQLPREKAILGVPFYCRDRTNFIAYKDILARGGDANSDIFEGCHYNGLTTMQAKAELALARAGGIMFWELSQDVQDHRSLLTRIYDTFQGNPVLPVDPVEPGECEAPVFTPGQTYSSGDQVQYQGNLYQARWWSDTAPPGSSWELIGPCQ